jgi:hypothetical protein
MWQGFVRDNISSEPVDSGVRIYHIHLEGVFIGIPDFYESSS